MGVRVKGGAERERGGEKARERERDNRLRAIRCENFGELRPSASRCWRIRWRRLKRRSGASSSTGPRAPQRKLLVQREIVIDNLLVRFHSIIVMTRWTGLAPWDFDFPYPGGLTSTLLACLSTEETSQETSPAPLEQGKRKGLDGVDGAPLGLLPCRGTPLISSPGWTP